MTTRGKGYIEEQFREMIALGYSAKETISSLEEDENVDHDALKEFIKEAESA